MPNPTTTPTQIEQDRFMDHATRKADRWSQVAARPAADFPTLVKALPRYTSTEIYANPNSQPMTYFKKLDIGPWFLLDRGSGGLFIVDTEGYEYARYILKVTE